jgi:hypothetical protein
MSGATVFLLSPAHCGGKRAGLLLRPGAEFELARRLRSPGGAPVGQVFAFLSGLYFRGKLTYAGRFGAAPPPAPGALVITTDRGLLPPYAAVRPADLAAFAAVPVDRADARYREPLAAGVEAVAAALPRDARFVLLGSVATGRYVDLLLELLGERLWFPEPFVGMGDMQRGALLLRAADSGLELPSVRAAGAVRSRAAVRRRV